MYLITYSSHISKHTIMRYILQIPCKQSVPVPVAARSKAWVGGRSPAQIAGSNPAGGMDVCLRVVSCQVEISATSWSLVQRSLPTVVRCCVCARNLKNEEAAVRVGRQCYRAKIERTCLVLNCGCGDIKCIINFHNNLSKLYYLLYYLCSGLVPKALSM